MEFVAPSWHEMSEVVLRNYHASRLCPCEEGRLLQNIFVRSLLTYSLVEYMGALLEPVILEAEMMLLRLSCMPCVTSAMHHIFYALHCPAFRKVARIMTFPMYIISLPCLPDESHCNMQEMSNFCSQKKLVYYSEKSQQGCG